MKLLLASVVCLFLAGQQIVNSQARHTITGIEVLNGYIAATGGLEHHRDLHAVEIKGELTVPPHKPNGNDFRFLQDSIGDLFELETRSHGIVRVGHKHGNRLWQRTTGGIGAINDVSVFLMEDTFRSVTEWDWNTNFSKIEFLGATEMDGKKALAIGLTSKHGDRQVRYYDSETFLLVRIDEAQRVREFKGEDAAFKVETYLSDYRPTDGILFPHKIVYQCSVCGVQLTVHSIKTNTPIDDAVFRER